MTQHQLTHAELMEGARKHGEAAGSESEIDDLRTLFSTAFCLLSDDQRAAFFADSEVVDLMDTPEYDGVVKD
jgi:hypothetical protein